MAERVSSSLQRRAIALDSQLALTAPALGAGPAYMLVLPNGVRTGQCNLTGRMPVEHCWLAGLVGECELARFRVHVESLASCLLADSNVPPRPVGLQAQGGSFGMQAPAGF